MNQIQLLLVLALCGAISIVAPSLQAHEPQPVKAHHLIQAGLSSQGYLKASGIMQLDEVLLHLAGQTGSDRPMFGLHLYWHSLLGEPSEEKPWGWQLDGHHLALNFSIVDHHVAMTPTFMAKTS